MKKIEEKYLESEHQVRAYDVYLSSYRVKGANRVLAYSRLYDGDKFIRDNFLVNEQQADKIEAMFDLVNRILETCKDIDLFTIRVSNKTFANLVKNADFAEESNRYFGNISRFKRLLGKREVIIVIPNWCTANKKDYAIDEMAKDLYAKIPSSRVFSGFCIKKNWIEKGFIEDLWDLLWKNEWRQKDGNYCDDWRTLAGAYNSVCEQARMQSMERFNLRKKKLLWKEKGFFQTIFAIQMVAAITIPPIRQVVLRILL